MKKAKILLTIVLVIALLLPVLSACKVDVFPGGKEALFDEKYQPKSALLQLLSGEKFKKMDEFERAFLQAKTPRKVDFDAKINSLTISEGMQLNSSNKLSGSFIFSDTNVEGNIDVSAMGNNIKANLYANSDNIAVEFSEALGKYLNVPLSDLFSDELNSMFPSITPPTPDDLAAFDAAINELSKKAIEIVKSNIPDTNIENKKEKIEYGGKKVNADVVVVKLDNEQFKKIFIDILKYIKDDSRIEKVFSAYTSAYFMSDSFSDVIDEMITGIESSEDEEKVEIELTATFVKATLVSVKMKVDTKEGIVNVSFDFEQKDGVNAFKFDVKGPKNETVTMLYTEDTKANEYKLKVDSSEEFSSFEITLSIPDDSNIILNFKSDALLMMPEFTIKLTIVEITDKVESIKIQFIMDGKADIELSYRLEILDSYTFNMPTLTEDNSFDITDPEQLDAFIEELGDSYSWLTDLLGFADIPPIDDLEIEFIDNEEYETNGALMPASFTAVLDGDGGFMASTSYIYVNFDYKNDEILYNYSDYESETFTQLYFDGTDWFEMDSVNFTLKKIDTAILWLSELMLFSEEAEFVKSGVATDGTTKLYYEVFHYPTFDSEVCFFFCEDSQLLYVSDGINNYNIMLFDTTDDYIADTISDYTK